MKDVRDPVLVDITKDVTEAIVDYEPAKPYPIRKTETENCELKPRSSLNT